MAGDTPPPHEPPPGWYPDPEEPNRWRWWNGSEWTEARSAVDPSTKPKWSTSRIVGIIVGIVLFVLGLFILFAAFSVVMFLSSDWQP